MTLQDLRTLLDYHYWGRDRLLEELETLTPEQFTRSLGGSFGSIRDTVAHIHAADSAWYQRWQGQTPTALLKPERFPDVASVRQAWSEIEQQTRAFVESLGEAGVTRVFEYKLLSGAAGSSPFWEMLYHVVNHATYHRGQVTTLIRQVGGKPQSTDAIGFFRSRQQPA